ncbi:hypothetical protein FZEAL_8644 [Fusarium zealandicum]|uniref:CorA-like transporter domain-containing protein n=1 Tax=Fusarium zealandicum TaxID=1053134 RepID=A0A8H4UED5_9HYPO|nr:hypothetical protein FZEAL_8644 [Fusarium zealandicum]
MDHEPAKAATDFFERSCEKFEAWPYNFTRSRLGASARQAAADTWDREAKRVFKAAKPLLRFMEIHDTFDTLDQSESNSERQAVERCPGRPVFEVAKNLEDLVSHLHGATIAPRIRYISVQSRSSKDSLNCSPAMFKYLCTYHQIPPSIMNSVYSFKTTLSSHDYNLALFHDDNTLLAREEHILRQDQLGRSGREIRYSFLLRSVEGSDSIQTQKTPWAIRQLAVYHSFDVVSGRALWLTCKGNSVIEDRFRDVLSDDSAFRPDALQTVPEAFCASLDVLMMILDWCDDNWRWYINEIANEVNKKARKASTVTIEDDADFGKIRRLVTGVHEQRAERLSRTPSLESGVRLQNIVRGFSFSRKPSVDDQSVHLEEDIDKLQSLKIFSFNELQVLQAALENIQEALLVLKLNHQVIKQIRDHYQTLMNQYRIPEMKDIQEQCKNSLLELCRHSKGVEANIEARQAQLDSLLLLVQESKALYDGILQYRSFQINKIYAESAQMSARKMEVIANRTKQETTSMHIITFVTLIFLPGTFIASFFQSGILEWPPLEPKDQWKLNSKVFGLFMGISLTMTAIIICIYMVALYMLRRQLKAGA